MVWDELQRSIAGEIAIPGSPTYEQRHDLFNARFLDVRPAAIVSCATPQDVAETVTFLERHGIGHATRSGGHCFAGHATSRGAVIDVSPMHSVDVDGDVARVGAGARLGDVYDVLQEHHLAIPGGTCPPVGIAGLALGGGLGILGRMYGVTSDRMLQAQVVLADGRIVECDDNHHEDLFWAFRGAGTGNFGVVTSLVFRTVPAPDTTCFHVTWPCADAAAVIEAWQAWAPVGPDELAASLKVTAAEDPRDLDRPSSVDVYGALLGSESDADELVDGLVDRAGADPDSTSSRSMSFPAARRFWANLGVAEAGAEHDPIGSPAPPRCLFAKSEFFGRPLSPDVIAALVARFTEARANGESRELDFMPWGGAYNRVPPDATAFVHRNELFQIKHSAVLDMNSSTRSREAANRWVSESWTTVHPYGSGRVFPNFADPELVDWPHAYYGTNYERLVRVKARYDPANVFRHDQSLPVR
jgi:FAD/FMN-containing dehydrogenase